MVYYRASNRQPVSTKVYLVGGSTLSLLPAGIVTLANSHIHFCGQSASCSEDTRVQTFHRVDINGRMYFSARYGHVHARNNSYTVAYRCREGTQRFGLVEYYCVLPELVGTALVVVKQLEILPISRHTQFDSAINHVANIIPVQESLRWDVTDLNKIESKCLFINFLSGCNDKYVIILPVEYMHN